MMACRRSGIDGHTHGDKIDLIEDEDMVVCCGDLLRLIEVVEAAKGTGDESRQLRESLEAVYGE